MFGAEVMGMSCGPTQDWDHDYGCAPGFGGFGGIAFVSCAGSVAAMADHSPEHMLARAVVAHATVLKPRQGRSPVWNVASTTARGDTTTITSLFSNLHSHPLTLSLILTLILMLLSSSSHPQR